MSTAMSRSNTLGRTKGEAGQLTTAILSRRARLVKHGLMFDGTLARNTHFVRGFGLLRGNQHARNHTHYCSNTAVNRRVANVAVFKWLGYYPGGGLGLILIIVVILVLVGRI